MSNLRGVSQLIMIQNTTPELTNRSDGNRPAVQMNVTFHVPLVCIKTGHFERDQTLTVRG